MTFLTEKRIVLISFAIMLSLGSVMMLVTLPELQRLAGGLKPFDIRLTGYKPDAARDLLGALGREGLDYYRHVQLPIDFIFPLFFALAIGLPSYRFNKSEGAYRRIQTLKTIFIAAPVFAACCDYWENWKILQMLDFGPNAPTELIETASRATTLKIGFGVVAIAGLIFGALQHHGRRQSKD